MSYQDAKEEYNYLLLRVKNILKYFQNYITLIECNLLGLTLKIKEKATLYVYFIYSTPLFIGYIWNTISISLSQPPPLMINQLQDAFQPQNTTSIDNN